MAEPNSHPNTPADPQPNERTTDQIIADARARQDALSKVDTILEQVTGVAHDQQNTVEVTVDGRGKLRNLWLAPEALRYGPDTLGRVIVDVARVAMDDATQNGYNKVALLLGDNLTYALEQLSGRAAPARRDPADGLTAEQFQRRRDERMRQAGLNPDGTPLSAPSPAQSPGQSAAPADRTGLAETGNDLASFDASSLRSDR